MPTYEYIAKDQAGQEFCGTFEDIADVKSLRNELTKVGCVLVKARGSKGLTAGRSRITQKDIVAFAYTFSSMYSAGLSVIQCLETLENQTGCQALKTVISDIRRKIEVGSSLTEAFEPHQKVFSPFLIGMLEAGEAACKLSEALEASAVYLEKRAELNNRIRSAFVYPISVAVVSVGVIFCLLLFVVPIFIKLYENLHVPLPWPTLFLITLSHIVRHWWWLILGLIPVEIWIGRKILRSPDVRRQWDRFRLRMPVLGPLNRLVMVSRFVRPFSMLSSVGVSVIEAFRLSGAIVHSQVMSEISEEIQKATQAGSPVGKTLEGHRIFPPVVVQMAISGEKVGQLPEMMAKGADILDREIQQMIDALVVKIEPVLTLAMGAFIGVLLLGIYLPMFDYMTHLK